jgi:hypothetical protein
MADDFNYPASMISAPVAMLNNRPDFGMVIASRDGFYDAVKWHMATSTRAMTTFHVGVFKLTGPTTMTKIVTLGNVKSLLAAATTLQVMPLPDPIDVVAGEIFYVGLLSNAGTVAQLYGTQAVSSPNAILTSGGSPELDMLTTKTSAAGITDFSAATYTVLASPSTTIGTGYIRPWVALGNLAVPVRFPNYQVDTFNQINTPNLSLPWASRADLSLPTFGTYNDTASPNTGANGAFTYRMPSCRNNDHYAQVRLAADMATAAGVGLDFYIGIRSGRGGAGNAVKLHVKTTVPKQFRIVTVTSAYNNSGLTQRAAMPSIPDFVESDVIKIVAAGPVYAAFLNDEPVVSWNDAGALSPIDIDHQWVNMMCGPTSTANLQIADNFECGAYGGGVQLIGPTGIPSAEATGVPTFINDVAAAPSVDPLIIVGYPPTIPTGPAVIPDPAQLSLTTYPPDVHALTVFQTDTVSVSNATVPAAARGCWVTLRGAGGGGGGGYSGSTAANRFGGGGAGGGAFVGRFFIRRDQLSATYTLSKGVGGNGGGPGAAAGTDGSSSYFQSGTVQIVAGGGQRGCAGTVTTAPSTLGAGGTVTTNNFTLTTPNSYGQPGAPRGYGNNAGATGGGAGGGSGGYISSDASTKENGYGGGSTTGATAGAGGTSHGGVGGNTSNSLLYGGGGGAGGAGWTNGNYAGGGGGTSGGGGGGAGATAASANNIGGYGGDGFVQVEWVS